MKKITYILTFIFIATSISINAQRGKKERIKALKIAHLTEELNLTEAEAQKFWPVYNKFEKDRRELMKKEKQDIYVKIKKAGGIEDLTEEEANNFILLMNQYKASHHELKSGYHSILINILSAKQILKLEIAEKDFHRKLLRKFRTKKRKIRE